MSRPDFPRNLKEFIARFGTEEACWKYLVASRWPGGFVCPICGAKGGYFLATRRLFQCPNGHQVSVTAGTVMHRSKIPLCTWFWAAYFVTTHTPGMSALQFARRLGLSYETVYIMLQKLRAGMVNPEREPLQGTVEVDESYIGGKQAGPGGRGARGKALVIGAVEVKGLNHGTKAGRIRLRLIPAASAEHLIRFIMENVQRGAIIRTDGWLGYQPLERLGWRHIVVEGETSVEVAKGLPHIHRVFGNLKSWLVGTHHGVSPKHLQAYLNEFTFRFNRRKTPMAAFQTILGIGSNVGGPTYDQVYAAGTQAGWIHPNPLG